VRVPVGETPVRGGGRAINNDFERSTGARQKPAKTVKKPEGIGKGRRNVKIGQLGQKGGGKKDPCLGES